MDIHVIGFLTISVLPQNVWILFAESSLSHQALVAVLHHFVHVGQQKRADAEQRVFALHAAGLYFLLLEIPGEPAGSLRIPARPEVSLISVVQLEGVGQPVILLECVTADAASAWCSWALFKQLFSLLLSFLRL